MTHGVFYTAVPPVQLRHCLNCGVEWEASSRRCWVCGRFGPAGKTPRTWMSGPHTMLFNYNNEEDLLCP